MQLEQCLRLRTTAHQEGDHLREGDQHLAPLNDRAVHQLRGLRVRGRLQSKDSLARDPGVATPGPRRV
eukprot:15440253-Alexandrium_andersonii.AAC.1